jgi:large subunit ribosomal protein L24
LFGSLAGTGTVTLENAQLAGLNPRVFDAVIRAVDLGVPTDANRIRDFVATALETGMLPAARAEAAIAISAGQARLSSIVTQSSGADLSASANLDLIGGDLNATLTLTGMPALSGGAQPALSIALKGPWTAPSRSVDAGALAGWLALRQVEQQAKEIDAMERQQRERAERERLELERLERERLEREAKAAVVSASDPSATRPSEEPPAEAAPPLPAAINVLPAPRPRVVAPKPAAPSPPKAAAPKPAASAPQNQPLNLIGAQN